MWVRSQNKEALIDVKAFDTVKDKEKIYIICCQKTIGDNYIYLGIYKNQEKAMQVLDDLQCRIARSESGVYQMPEDEE